MKRSGQSSTETPDCGKKRGQWGAIRPATKAKVGCINVMTMGKFGEGRDELICATLHKYGLDICAISETKWKASGKREIGNYAVYYSGVREDQLAYGGVAIAIKANLMSSVSTWCPVNERIVWVRFDADSVSTTVIGCYAPTEVASRDEKELFYKNLQIVLKDVPRRDLVILMGDFNARVAGERNVWKGVIGRFGFNDHQAGENDNGERLLEFCAVNNFCLSSTFFEHKDVHKVTLPAAPWL